MEKGETEDGRGKEQGRGRERKRGVLSLRGNVIFILISDSHVKLQRNIPPSKVKSEVTRISRPTRDSPSIKTHLPNAYAHLHTLPSDTTNRLLAP